MECPNCKEKLDFIAPVFMNCEIYGEICKGVTTCCGKIIAISRVISFKAWIPEEEIEEDDWGYKEKGE